MAEQFVCVTGFAWTPEALVVLQQELYGQVLFPNQTTQQYNTPMDGREDPWKEDVCHTLKSFQLNVVLWVSKVFLLKQVQFKRFKGI